MWAPWRAGEATRQEPSQAEVHPITNPEPKIQEFKGWFDLRVAKKKTGKLHWLHETPARPLEIGDEIRMVAELNKPGYCYILWIDAKGEVVPFYPWLDGDWSKKLPETKVQRLDLPDGPGVFAIDETSPTGMETIVLLVRDEPLPDDTQLKKLIGQLQPTPKLEDGGRLALWFRNGLEVTDEAERAPTIRLPENDVFRTQDLLRTKLGAPTFQYSRAVVFGTRGK